MTFSTCMNASCPRRTDTPLTRKTEAQGSLPCGTVLIQMVMIVLLCAVLPRGLPPERHMARLIQRIYKRKVNVACVNSSIVSSWSSNVTYTKSTL